MKCLVNLKESLPLYSLLTGGLKNVTLVELKLALANQSVSYIPGQDLRIILSTILRRKKKYEGKKKPGRVHFWYAVDTNLFRLGSSILEYAGSRGAVPMVDTGGRSTPLKKKLKNNNLDKKKYSKNFPTLFQKRI